MNTNKIAWVTDMITIVVVSRMSVKKLMRYVNKIIC